MSKDKSEKKEKKEKRRSDVDGVTKKAKKEKRKSSSGDATTALLNELETEKPGSVAVDADGDIMVADVNGDAEEKAARPIGALVPFANPLADEKTTKKVLKSVKKCTCFCIAYRPPSQVSRLRFFIYGFSTVLTLLYSRQSKDPQARCERSRQIVT